ncbi:hypothetical protein QBC44DRAFT_385482 [Cladorrhinum sp. PSN332]|nr:hypothetical protein QBC44DRAFT_385482 [Cladorrhinum sp. PSN332]
MMTGGRSASPSRWRPFFLRPVVLLTLIVVFTTLILALAALFFLSSRNERVAPADPKLRYLWIYGPTAVFAALAALWAPVDYRAKQMTPWMLMAKDAQPAGTSLLLDYISPLNIVNLYKSLRYKHWMVFCTVSGTFLLQSAVIISSSLFISAEQSLRHDKGQLLITDRFSATSLGPVDAMPATNVYAILTSNLSYPLGTSHQYSFQQFQPLDNTSLALNLTASVEVFEGTLSCELANMTSLSVRPKAVSTPNTLPDSPTTGGMALNPSFRVTETIEADLVLETDSCSGLHISIDEKSSFAYNGSFCSNGRGSESQITENGRLVIITGNWSSSSKSPGRDFTPDYGLVCNPSFSVQKGEVALTRDMNGNFIPVSQILVNGQPDSAANQALSGVTSLALLTEFARTLAESQQSLSLDMEGFIEAAMPPALRESKDSAVFQTALSELFGLVTAQIANTYLKVAENTSVPGVTISRETRLVISVLSFALMEASLVLLVLLTGCLLFALKEPGTAASRDPSTISGMATILARSGKITTKLQNTGALDTETLSQLLKNDRFSSRVEKLDDDHQQAFTIERAESVETGPLLSASDLDSVSRNSDSASDTKMKWYREFPVTIPGQTLILGAFPALIISLELLYQHSARNRGLTTIQSSDTAAHYSWTYIPSAVMVGMSLLLGSLSTSMKIIDPYHTLRQGKAPVDTSISENHLRYIAVSAFWNGLRKRRWAVAAAGLAGLMAPFLTIITSGLLLTEPAVLTGPTKVTRLDSFNLSTTDSATGVRYANMVLSNNVSDPTWTHHDLALPQLQLDDISTAEFGTGPSESIGNPASFVSISSLEAARGILNCTPITFEQLDACAPNPRPALWDSYFPTPNTKRPKIKENFTGTGYFGQIFAVGSIIFDDIYDPKCPSVVAVAGHTTNNMIDTASYLGCMPFVETVPILATFMIPSWQLVNISSPPGGNGQSDSELSNPHISHVPDFFDELDGRYSFLSPMANVAMSSDVDLGGIFPVVLYGRNGTPIADMVGPENVNRLMDTLETTYQIIMAQILSNSRRPAQGSALVTTKATRNDNASTNEQGHLPYEGVLTVQQPGRLRLHQNLISTRILEGLLGFMFCCVVLTYALLRHTRSLLPKNPCSIAAVASLLAGSVLLDTIPEGSEWLSDEEVRKAEIFEGKLFTMGWWETKNEDGEVTGRRFGIDFEYSEDMAEKYRLKR